MKKIRILSLILTMILMLSVFCMPKASASTYTVSVIVTAGNSNANRVVFYTTGAATVQSTSLTSGSDPALYDETGKRIADDEAGNSHFKYTTTSGTKYYAGTYSHGAAKYTITSNAPITLVRNGYPAYLGEYEGYYKIKHVQSGKFLTAVTTAGANQYTLTLSTSSTSDYQRWRFKTVSVSDKSYQIINGGYTTRYLARDTSAQILFLGEEDGFKSKTLTSSFTCYVAKKSGSANVFIKTSTGASTGYALSTNYHGDVSPHFYVNSFGEDNYLGEWQLVPVYIKGDVDMDGKVTGADATLALKASSNQVTLTDLQKFLADMDNDGNVYANDANIILAMT